MGQARPSEAPDAPDRERLDELKRELRDAYKTNYRRVLREQGLSIKELARRSGIGESTLYRYLYGDRVPSITTAQLIASATGTELSDFIPTRPAGSEQAGRPGQPGGE